MLNMEKTQVQMSDFIPNAVSLLSVMSNTVDMIRVEKYFSQLVRTDKLSRLDRQSCRVENASHYISLLGTATKFSSRTSEQVVSTRQSSRVETRSTRTDAKEQAPYTLCMPRSISNDPIMI